MTKPCFVFSTPFSRSSDRSRSATNSGPVKSTAGRCIACSTRCGMLVGPGCMKNCQPRETLIAISPGGSPMIPALPLLLPRQVSLRLRRIEERQHLELRRNDLRPLVEERVQLLVRAHVEHRHEPPSRPRIGPERLAGLELRLEPAPERAAAGSDCGRAFGARAADDEEEHPPKDNPPAGGSFSPGGGKRRGKKPKGPRRSWKGAWRGGAAPGSPR